MRELSVRQLRLFLRLSETGNLTEAAHQHGVTQPALSRSIKEMEGLLGYLLFDRNARGVSLTGFGARLLPIAKHIVAEYDFGFATLEEFAAAKPERLLIASVMSMMPLVVAPALARLSSTHPNIELCLASGLASDIVEAVCSGKAEVGFVVKPDPDPRLIYTSLMSDSLLVVCPADDPLATRESANWKILQGKKLFTLNSRSMLSGLITEQLNTAMVTVDSVIECQEFGQMGALIGQRLGLAVIPSSALPLLGSGFAALPIQPVVTRQLGIITRSGRPLTLAASDLVATVMRSGGRNA